MKYSQRRKRKDRVEKPPWKGGEKVVVSDRTFVQDFIGMRGTVVKCYKTSPWVEWSAEVNVLPSVKGGRGRVILVLASALDLRNG